MQVRIVMEITNTGGKTIASEVVADLTKATKGPEDLGLSLAESKTLLAKTPAEDGGNAGGILAEGKSREGRTPHPPLL
ncbi:hypothetical protein [Mesorhizobium sp. 1B3]|uniref:hypothetical protein n=1 Tax=Mesorhizobium sp. 1B3 TaxID=3243599 RepID=UPI003D97D84C